MKTIIACLLILVLSLIVTPVFAGDYSEGIDAYRLKDYKAAYKKLKPLAEQGFVKAQSNLATMYNYGEGITRDYKVAVEWYRKAAEQGNAEAQSQLGHQEK